MSSHVLEDEGTGEAPVGGEHAAAAIAARILVPVDFSGCSLAALDHAVSLAERLGSSIDVLHIWAVPRTLGAEDGLALPDQQLQTVAQVAESRAGEAMDAVMSELWARGIEKARGRLDCGEPSDSIVRIAREESYDLIIMGTHGHTGLSHLLHGSVAEKVVRLASCPVLTIRTVDPAVDQQEESEQVNEQKSERMSDSEPGGRS